MARGTLPSRLRSWATARDRKPGIDGNLLREAADEIEKLRQYVKQLEARTDKEALLALVRYLGEGGNLPMPVSLHAQLREALGDDFYRTVDPE